MIPKIALSLADALTASGYPCTWDADQLVVRLPEDEGTLRFSLGPIEQAFQQGASYQMVSDRLQVMLSQTLAARQAMGDSVESLPLDALRLHLLGYPTAMSRPVAPGLYLTPALDLPDAFVMVDSSELGLDTTSIWDRATRQTAQALRDPDERMPLTERAAVLLWVGPDAADQAWAHALTLSQAYMAVPCQEEALLVVGATEVADALPVFDYVAETTLEPFQHPLIPHMVLELHDGRTAAVFDVVDVVAPSAQDQAGPLC